MSEAHGSSARHYFVPGRSLFNRDVCTSHIEVKNRLEMIFLDCIESWINVLYIYIAVDLRIRWNALLMFGMQTCLLRKL